MSNIMIVDDEALVLLDLTMTVEDLGYGVHSESTSIASAMGALEVGPPDLALLDIDVAGEPVWPLARALAADGSEIIFISANLSHKELQTEFAHFARLEKPVSRREIEDAMRVALPKSQRVA
ncbi:MAG: hypothetical protein HKO05_00345 [Erythrobacter sp.]|nr:hypothetical protein [Erythrobacter sp.]